MIFMHDTTSVRCAKWRGDGAALLHDLVGHSGEALFVALVVVSYAITFGAPLSSATSLRIAVMVAAGVLISGVTLGAAAWVVGRSSESVTFAAFWSLYVPVLL